MTYAAGTKEQPAIHRLQRVYIADPIIPLPLGWRLSKAGSFQIDRQMGQISHCQPDDHFEQGSKTPGFTSADCVQLLVYHQLRPAMTSLQRFATRRTAYPLHRGGRNLSAVTRGRRHRGRGPAYSSVASKPH